MPNGWEVAHLGELMTQRTDFTPIDRASTYPVAGVQRSGWGLIDREPLAGHESKFSKLLRLETDNLVYRTITAFEAPSAVVDVAHAGCFVTPQTFPVFRLDASRLLPGFMRLITTWPVFHNAMSERCTGTVLRRKTLAVAAFRSIPIPLPPLCEQRRIVDLIGAVDDAIEAAEHLWHELSDLADSLVSQVQLESHRQGWDSTTLVDALGGEAAIRTGPFGSQLHQTDYVSGGPVAVVMPANIKNQEVDMSSVSRITAEEAERLSRHRVQVGDILWSRRGDVTRFAVIDSASESAICGTGCFLLRPGSSTISDWLSLWLATPVVRNWLIEKAVGATMANLNRTILAGIPIRTPSTARQTQLVEGWRAIRDNQVATATQVSRLGYLRSNLLSVLLQGEPPIPESYDVLIGA